MGYLKSNFSEGYVVATNNVPVVFVEHVVLSVNPRGFEGVEGLEVIFDFSMSKRGFHGIGVV